MARYWPRLQISKVAARHPIQRRYAFLGVALHLIGMRGKVPDGTELESVSVYVGSVWLLLITLSTSDPNRWAGPCAGQPERLTPDDQQRRLHCTAALRHASLSTKWLIMGVSSCPFGLTASVSGPNRFEVNGADAARSFIKERGFSDHRAQLIWDLVALNSTPSIALHKEAEVALGTMGYWPRLGRFRS
jgi:hypothetical protein